MGSAVCVHPTNIFPAPVRHLIKWSPVLWNLHFTEKHHDGPDCQSPHPARVSVELDGTSSRSPDSLHHTALPLPFLEPLRVCSLRPPWRDANRVVFYASSSRWQVLPLSVLRFMKSRDAPAWLQMEGAPSPTGRQAPCRWAPDGGII